MPLKELVGQEVSFLFDSCAFATQVGGCVFIFCGTYTNVASFERLLIIEPYILVRYTCAISNALELYCHI